MLKQILPAWKSGHPGKVPLINVWPHPQILSASEEPDASDLSFYPNPFSNKATISYRTTQRHQAACRCMMFAASRFGRTWMKMRKLGILVNFNWRPKTSKRSLYSGTCQWNPYKTAKTHKVAVNVGARRNRFTAPFQS